MLLNSWKEIAEYLNCGVRTAQRWHRDLHLPVTRVRSGRRGPVMARSEALDDWMIHRSSSVTAMETWERSSAATERTVREGNSFLWLELETGQNFAELAKTSKHPATIGRRRRAARKAYDTIHHYLSRKTYLPKSQLKTFHEELRAFRRELEQLGEAFDT